MAVDDWPSLVEPGDLAEFPGAPFKSNTVKAAAGQVRRICGWHIAPVVSETLVLDHDGSSVLYLPSLKIESVEKVEDLTGTTPRELSGWRWSGVGLIEGAFPRGYRSVAVTLTHGYAECPADLLPVLASRTQRRAMQESLGSRSVAYSAEGDRAFESTLDSYRLGPRP